jgi:hypothetical protein
MCCWFVSRFRQSVIMVLAFSLTVAHDLAGQQPVIGAKTIMGAVDGPPLTHVVGVQVIGDVVFIADRVPPMVHRFRLTTGEYLGSIGREGEGPGEYKAITHLATAGDSLWVYDPRLRRGSWYSPDGEFLGSSDFRLYPFSVTAALPLPANRHLLIPPRRSFDPFGEQGSEHPIYIARPNGETEEVTTFGVGAITATTRQGVSVLGAVPVRDLWELDHEGGRLVMIRQSNGDGQATLRTVDLRDLTVVEKVVPFSPIEADAAFRETVLAERLEAYGRQYEDAGVARNDILTALDFPEYLPFARNIELGPQGQIWFGRWGVGGWLVMLADGTRVEVAAPEPFRLWHVGPDYILGVVTDRFDVPTVVRFDLRWD